MFVITAAFTETAQAKSVYATINFSSRIIAAYDIQGDQIEYQTQGTFSNEPVGLSIDPNSQIMFATSHYGNEILMINTKTMTRQGTVEAPGETKLKDIAFDSDGTKICNCLQITGLQRKPLHTIGNYDIIL